jgi:hypothetical protein
MTPPDTEPRQRVDAPNQGIKIDWGADIAMLRQRVGGIAYRGRQTSSKVAYMEGLSQRSQLWIPVEAESYFDVDETQFNGYTKTPAIIASLKNLQPLATEAVLNLRKATWRGGKLFIRSAGDVIVGYLNKQGTWEHANKSQLNIEPGMEDMDIRRLMIEDVASRLEEGHGYIDPHYGLRKARVISGESHMADMTNNPNGVLFAGMMADIEGYFGYKPLSYEQIVLYVMGLHKAKHDSGIKANFDAIAADVYVNRPAPLITKEQQQDFENGPTIESLLGINGLAKWDSLVLSSRIQESLGVERGDPQFEENYYRQILLHKGTPLERLRIIEGLVRWVDSGDIRCKGNATEDLSVLASKKIKVSNIGSWRRMPESMNGENYEKSLGLVFYGAMCGAV